MISNLIKRKNQIVHIENEMDDATISAQEVNNSKELFFKDLTKEKLEYFKSTEYGKKVRVNILEKNLLTIDWSKLGRLIYKSKKMREDKLMTNICLYPLIVVLILMSLGFLIGVTGGVLAGEYGWMENFGLKLVNVSCVLWGMTPVLSILVMLGMELKSKRETKDKLTRHVMDEDGNLVKAIWYQYHNGIFKSLDDREKFLEKKYDDLNYDLEAYVHKSKDVERDLENYLKEWSHKENLRWAYEKLTCW